MHPPHYLPQRIAYVRLVQALSVCVIALLSGCSKSSPSDSGDPSSQTVAPTISTQPASVTVAAGQTATFNVTASGTALLTYQWLSHSAAISGATSRSYTTPALTAQDDGNSFNVVVTNTAGSATSTLAVVTVTSGAGGNSCGVVPTIPSSVAA